METQSNQVSKHSVVDVIIPVGPGDQPYSGLALQSILDSRSVNLKVFVILDGRLNPPEEMAAIHDERVIFMVNEGLRGVAGAMNFGVTQSQSKYIAVMHADDVAHPSRLALQQNLLDEFTHVVALGSDVTTPDNILKLNDSFVSIDETLIQVFKTRDLIDSNPLVDPTTMFRRTAMESVGGYRDGMTSMQDYELLLSIAQFGQVARIRLPLLGYRIHQGQYSRRSRDREEWNQIFRARKRLSIVQLNSALPAYIAHVRYLVYHAGISLGIRSKAFRSRILPQ